MKLNLYLRPSKTPVKPIYLYVSMNGERKKFHTGEICEERDWDSKKQKVKAAVTGARFINDRLTKIGSDIENLKTELRGQGRKITFEDIHKMLNPEEVKKEEAMTFLRFIEEAIEAEKSFVKKSVYQHEIAALNYLKKFNEKKKFGLDFHNIDEYFYKSWITFLSDSPVEEAKAKTKATGKEIKAHPMLNNAIGSHVKTLKKYCKKAYKKGLLKNTDFESFEVIKEKVKKTTYTEEDILKVYRREHPPFIRRAVDLNTFRFYAGGLRHGEIKYIKKENIIDILVRGKHVKGLSFAQEKTTAANAVILNDICLEILQRYNYELPDLDGQVCNRHMKRAFEAAGYTKDVKVIRHSLKKRVEYVVPEYELLGRSHAARYSAVRMIVERTGNIYLAKEIVGHSDVKTTEGYMQMDEQFKHSEYLKIING